MLNKEACWWSTKSLVNGKSVLAKDPDLIIEMDASIQGWGAVCKDVCTRGLWLQEERENHISYLELPVLAAMFAVKVLTKDQEDTHAHLCMHHCFMSNAWKESAPQQ